jgi:hypothetical protein
VGLYKGGRGLRPEAAGSAPSPPSAAAQRSRPTDGPPRRGRGPRRRRAGESSSWPRTSPPGASTGATPTGSPGKRGAPRPIVELIRAVSDRVERVRLLYLYPSSLWTTSWSRPSWRPGSPTSTCRSSTSPGPWSSGCGGGVRGSRFLDRIGRHPEQLAPEAGLRSSFILGYPGETEEDHDAVARGSCRRPSSTGPASSPSPRSPGPTPPACPTGASPPELALERLRECSELQDRITAERRAALVGETMTGARRRPRGGPVAPGGPGDRRHRAGSRSIMASRERSSRSWPRTSAGPDLWAEVAGPVGR